MRRILFIDRDGTLIEEPADFQIDRYEKLRFVDGMIPALLRLRDAGFEFVMVSNQDGLGTASFPRADFEGPQALLLQLLESQGIRFREVLIDESFEHEHKPTRKPGVGMLLHYLSDRSVDLRRSAVIGDRETDLQLARNLGCAGFRLGPGHATWAEIAHSLVDAPRRAEVRRSTRETAIRVALDLDRPAEPRIRTGLGFFDHMLEQLGKHAGVALELDCEGDLHIDEHHTVEDCALALGQAWREALADKRGIGRYGSDREGQERARSAPSDTAVEFALPMDEALAVAVLDLSGRPYFVFDGRFARSEVGGLATELVPHFFRSFCEAAGASLHLRVRGENAHHQVEACFKSFARALRAAVRREGRDLPSTKGVL
jgi:imidazoleglycerol-phosphate dehydratase/histidinol-phosphatase